MPHIKIFEGVQRTAVCVEVVTGFFIQNDRVAFVVLVPAPAGVRLRYADAPERNRSERGIR